MRGKVALPDTLMLRQYYDSGARNSRVPLMLLAARAKDAVSKNTKRKCMSLTKCKCVYAIKLLSGQSRCASHAHLTSDN